MFLFNFSVFMLCFVPLQSVSRKTSGVSRDTAGHRVTPGGPHESATGLFEKQLVELRLKPSFIHFKSLWTIIENLLIKVSEGLLNV